MRQDLQPYLDSRPASHQPALQPAGLQSASQPANQVVPQAVAVLARSGKSSRTKCGSHSGSPAPLPSGSPAPLPSGSPAPLPSGSPAPLPSGSPAPLPSSSLLDSLLDRSCLLSRLDHSSTNPSPPLDRNRLLPRLDCSSTNPLLPLDHSLLLPQMDYLPLHIIRQLLYKISDSFSNVDGNLQDKVYSRQVVDYGSVMQSLEQPMSQCLKRKPK
ncbi:mucin-1-like [Siniperca chuatsi]|uniref:mucin-1-like n=1 Tax=Siniperca chuatsi TaxID=119488 RepID=UPI001CE1E46C|nr:mucin-1-like [Siniperca chuatsi]